MQKLPPKPIVKGQIQRGLHVKPERIAEDIGSSLLEEVEEDLSAEGISPFDNSNVIDEYLRLPADITDSVSKDLGRYFNAFSQQKMYVRTLLGRTQATLRELNEELNSVKGLVYKSLPAKMSLTEKDLSLRSDEVHGKRSSVILKDLAMLEEKKRMLSDYLDSLVDGIVLISREISRREADWGDEERENSIERKRRR